jgi:AraC-like DNA-binding protein
MPKVIEKNIENQFEAITVVDLRDKYFDPNWHFHPHYQIFTVLEGSGTRFIGDGIQTFEPGDTVMIGPNLPHLWRSDKIYFENSHELFCHGIVVYFSEDFLGHEFWEKTEMKKLKQLFQDSLRGISLNNATKLKTIQILKELPQEKGFERILKLLELLHLLSISNDFEFICSRAYINSFKQSETERMQKVHEMVMKNFKNDIDLTTIAENVNMSVSAFCRYFKKRSNKTFMDFVNEIRIGNACKLLTENKYSISQVAYESGFNTLSNFNNQFKKITGKNPSEYLKLYKS